MRPLDFIAYGVPRSGTTALAVALNLHPDVLCAIERFQHTVPPNQLRFPGSLRDESLKCAPVNLKRTLELFTAKGDATPIVGNKNPIYYCGLKLWRDQQPNAKKLAIYRSPRFYLASWKRRAERERDPWHRHQQGFFGIYELYAMLQSTLDFAPDALLIPYDAMYFTNESTVDRVLAHIGADTGRFPRDQFMAEVFSSSKVSRVAPQLDADVEEMLAAINSDSIDSILLKDDAYIISNATDEIRNWFKSAPTALAEMAEASIRRREDEDLHTYLLGWVRRFPALPALMAHAMPPTMRTYYDLVSANPEARQVAAEALRHRAGHIPLVQQLTRKP